MLVQKLQFVMKCYHVFNNKDDADEFKIESMSSVVNGLKELSVPKMLDIYQHVSSTSRRASPSVSMEAAVARCRGTTDAERDASGLCTPISCSLV